MAQLTAYPYAGAYITETLQPLVEPTSGLPGENVAVFANAYNIGPIIPTLVTSWQQFILLYGDFNVANQNPLHYAVWSFFNNGGSQCIVVRVPNTDAITANLPLKDVATSTTTLFTAYANFGQNISGTGGFNNTAAVLGTPGAFGSNIYIQILPTITGNTAFVNLNVFYVPGGTPVLTSANCQPYLVETFVNVSTNPADPRFVQTIVNSPVSGSKYIQLLPASPYPTYVQGTTDFASLASPTALTTANGGITGSDGTTNPYTAFPLTVQQLLDQWYPNQVMTLNIPGGFATSNANNDMNTQSIVNSMVTWASQRENVMVWVDGPAPVFPETSSQVASNYAAMVGSSAIPQTSSFVSVFGPYLLVIDPASSNPGATRLIGPCASIMGLQSVVDAAVGTQQFAAGTSWGQLSCLDLEVRFTPADLTTLFPLNVNPIKLVPGFGFCVFGARTLLQGYPDMYIPIRRVLMKVEHDAIVLTQFAMFEVNTPELWANITTVLTNYLTQQTLANLLGTNNPQTAFSVTCNSSNNSQTSAQAGFVYITIALALGSPVEIMVINIAQMTGQATANPPLGTTGTTGNV